MNIKCYMKTLYRNIKQSKNCKVKIKEETQNSN